MCSCQCTHCTAGTNVKNTHLAIPTALSGLSPASLSFTRSNLKQLASGMCYCYLLGVCCRARLGVIFPRDHIMLGWQSSVSRASVQYPSTSVCISWHGRQLITIISHLVPSKKQISGIRATSSNCLSVCLGLSCFFF